MIVYRIGSTRFAEDLSGEGAKLFGGRWNHAGTPCIYAAATRSLALLEYTAHASIHLIPRALSFTSIELPAKLIKIFELSQLPGNWKQSPHPVESRDFGTDHLRENKFLVFGYPSAVIEDEYIYVINPNHPGANNTRILAIKDYAYDLRLKNNKS